MTTTVPEELLRRLRLGHRFLLTSHANPDGDAIGSEIGLARILRSLGKSVTIWNRDPVPAIYRALPGSDRIHVGTEPPAGFPDAFDSTVVLECPSLDRTGLEDHLDGTALINLDHHLGNQHYGQVNWVDPAAPAAGELVYRLAHALKVTLDRETATALYLTLVTDTGGFRFSNANPAAFESAATLVREGARPEQVSEWLYESTPLATIKLLAEMLRTLELAADGRVASALVTQEMMARAGATAGDTEGLTDYPRSIAGVAAAALLREKEPGQFKVSLRSRGEVDVEKVARHHGGGGHRNAAGCEIAGTADEVRQRIVADLTAAVA